MVYFSLNSLFISFTNFIKDATPVNEHKVVDGPCSSRWILLQDRKDSSVGHFGRFRPILANFVADKPFSDLNANLKPQKPSVEFISGKWKSLEFANSLLLPHMEGYWQLWDHFLSF